MEILILGGTGAIGVSLVNLLSADMSNNVSVTSRRVLKSHGNVSYIKGDAHDRDFRDILLSRRWDAIVDFMIYSTPEFAGCVGAYLGATRQYVYVSSSRVYASCRGLIDESCARLLDVTTDCKYLATDEYALRKARQEDLLAASGMGNYTIVRPYITYSGKRLQLGVMELESWLHRALQGRSIVFSEDLSCRTTTLTDGSDVANGMMTLIGNYRCLGKAFNIACGYPVMWSEVLRIYCDAIAEKCGVRPKVKMTPKWPVDTYQLKPNPYTP